MKKHLQRIFALAFIGAMGALMTTDASAQTAVLEGPHNGVIKVYWEGVNEIALTQDGLYGESLAVLRQYAVTNGNVTLEVAGDANNADAELSVFNNVTPNYIYVNLNVVGIEDLMRKTDEWNLWLQPGFVTLDGVPNANVELPFSLIEEQPAGFMESGVLYSPAFYSAVESKNKMMTTALITWGEPVSLTGTGDVTISLDDYTGETTLDTFGNYLEVDFGEWIFDLDNDVYLGQYTITLPAGVVKNSAGDINPAQTFTFNYVKTTDVTPTMTPLSGSEIEQGEYITFSWDGMGITHIATAKELYFEDADTLEETPIAFGEGVSITGSTLRINTSNVAPGDYYINIPGAYVELADGTVNASVYRAITITEYVPVYMAEGTMTSPEPVIVASRKADCPASIFINWGESVEITGNGEVKVSLGEYEGVADLYSYDNGNRIEVDFMEWLWDIPYTAYLGTYTITLPAGVVKNADREINPAQTFTYQVVERTSISPTISPYSGEEINQGALITITWGDQEISHFEGSQELYFATLTGNNKTVIPFGEGVTIVDSKALTINTMALTPGDYSLQLPEAYVQLANGTANAAQEFRYTILAVEDGVEAIEADGSGLWNVYRLDGVKILSTACYEDVTALPSGIYIINGKKTIIK